MIPPDVQLGLMLNLEPNRDGYGADRISPEVVEVAQEFVRLLMAVRDSENLFVSPGPNGGSVSSGRMPSPGSTLM